MNQVVYLTLRFMHSYTQRKRNLEVESRAGRFSKFHLGFGFVFLKGKNSGFGFVFFYKICRRVHNLTYPDKEKEKNMLFNTCKVY